MGQLLSLIAILVFGLGSLEGLNIATGGEVYLASVRHLVQEQVDALRTAPPAETPLPIPEQAPAPIPASPQGEPGTPAPMPTPPPPPPSPPSPPPQPLQPSEHPQSPEPPILEKGQQGEEEEHFQNFVDPQEVRRVLQEIKNFKAEIKGLIKSLKKMPGSEADIAKLNETLSEVDAVRAILANQSADDGELREALQTFYEGRYWDEMNKIRTKVQLPREIKDITTSLKRLKKITQTKAVRGFGLNLERVGGTITEMENALQLVKTHYDNGDYESASEEMQFFHEGGHPGEIEGVIFQIKDIKTMIKRVKDEAIRAEVDRVLQEVIDAFNEGEYRDARETMDAYSNELRQIIGKLIRSKARYGDRDASSKIKNLQSLIQKKLEEKSNGSQENQ